MIRKVNRRMDWKKRRKWSFLQQVLKPQKVSNLNNHHHHFIFFIGSIIPFVYRHINGLVLNFNSIIKDDYFPGSRNTSLVGNHHQTSSLIIIMSRKYNSKELLTSESVSLQARSMELAFPCRRAFSMLSNTFIVLPNPLQLYVSLVNLCSHWWWLTIIYSFFQSWMMIFRLGLIYAKNPLFLSMESPTRSEM